MQNNLICWKESVKTLREIDGQALSENQTDAATDGASLKRKSAHPSIHIYLTSDILDKVRFESHIDDAGNAADPTSYRRTEWTIRDRGVQGLYLRLTKTTTTWYVQRKVAGAPRREKLGLWWSAHAGYQRLSLKLARKKAIAWLGSVVEGRDPTAERKSRQEEVQAQRQRNALTLAAVYPAYAAKKTKPGAIHSEQMRKNVVNWMKHAPLWKMPIVQIDEAAIGATFRPFVDALSNKTAHPSWGPKSISPSTLDKMYWETLGAYRDTLKIKQLKSKTGYDPFVEWRSSVEWPAAVKRTRFLKVGTPEGRSWLKALLAQRERAYDENAGQPVNPFVAVMFDYYCCLLLWGKRSGETASLRWSQVDLENNRVSLRAQDTKSKQKDVIPLTPWAREILLQRRAHHQAWRPTEATESGFVFPSRAHNQHLTDGRRVLRLLEALSGVELRNHDLRRTLATHFASTLEFYEQGRLALVAAALNHASNSDITEDYILAERAEVLRPKYEQWEDQLRAQLDLPSLIVRKSPSSMELDTLLRSLDDDAEKERALVEAIARKRGWALSPTPSKLKGRDRQVSAHLNISACRRAQQFSKTQER